jgi:hypothetical protein
MVWPADREATASVALDVTRLSIPRSAPVSPLEAASKVSG